MPLEDCHEAFDVARLGLTSPEGPQGKSLEHTADILLGRRFRGARLVDWRHGEQFGERRRRRLVRVERPFGLDPVDPDGEGWPNAVLTVGVEVKSVRFFVRVVDALLVDPESPGTTRRDADGNFKDLRLREGAGHLPAALNPIVFLGAAAVLDEPPFGRRVVECRDAETKHVFSRGPISGHVEGLIRVDVDIVDREQ